MDRPILFSGPMVRALIEGRKTMTRRVLKPQPKHGFTPWQDEDTKEWMQSGYGEAGDDFLAVPYAIRDRLYVREAWNLFVLSQDGEVSWAADDIPKAHPRYSPGRHHCVLDFPVNGCGGTDGGKGPWRPSIHMPRWASRLTLTVTDVRVERLLDISEEDARAESFVDCRLDDGFEPRPLGDGWTIESPGTYASAAGMFLIYWQKLHKDWDGFDNPWVVALTFDVHQQNIDQMSNAA